MSNIVVKGSIVYLQVGNDWFEYDSAQKPLGAGAMGTVYIGHNCNTGKNVAIKRVNQQYARVPSIRQRAQIEAKMQFRHRNLVEMIGICEQPISQGGAIFIVSNLVTGINLDTHVKNNLRKFNDSVRRICQCMMPVLDALDYLHSKNIYHLDIKPSNIMIESGTSNIRLMDLGIVSIGENVDVRSGMIGTPQYAAPEQCDPTYGIIDASTDIYEAGVTLFELLANYNPYDAPSIMQTVQLHQSIQIPYVEGVSASIIEVLRKATSIRKEERYQTAMQFKKALQMALAAPPPKKSDNKYLWIIAAAALIIIILVTIIIVL